ncbi:MAG: radical SAM protein [Methylococcales symbiont of Hymedesmia sp. n. MRB-2018]|nr:MAG: radical SAM protein [Methylococcales symbiont of Hymedesmia sp. n. MRB-2018]
MNYKLTTADHSRDIAGLKYIYPVLSRRAGGLSIGINFNPNNACNWRCVYCQVPNLIRGSAPEMNFKLLEEEFRFFLDRVLKGSFYEQFSVPEKQRVIKDIAISGNGEPTSLNGFDKAIELIGQIALEQGVLPSSDFVLISNGSLMHHSQVQQGLKVLNHYNGQVWFKLDSATQEGRNKINDSRQSNKKMVDNLSRCSAVCDTRVQTCMLDFLSYEEMLKEKEAYVALLQKIRQRVKKVDKIMLYTIARPPLQPEAGEITKTAYKQMNLFADRLRCLGYQVDVSY